jgi:DNA-binding response OmpR family regulator
MAYLFKEKFNIAELAELPGKANRVVICEPEEYLAALYGHYLSQHNFDIKHCPQVDELKELLQNFLPRLLILNIEKNHIQSHSVLRLRRQFPNVEVITMGYNIGGDVVKELMSAGICGHIDRRLSRPKDLLYIVKALLNN